MGSLQSKCSDSSVDNGGQISSKENFVDGHKAWAERLECVRGIYIVVCEGWNSVVAQWVRRLTQTWEGPCSNLERGPVERYWPCLTISFCILNVSHCTSDAHVTTISHRCNFIQLHLCWFPCTPCNYSRESNTVGTVIVSYEHHSKCWTTCAPLSSLINLKYYAGGWERQGKYVCVGSGCRVLPGPACQVHEYVVDPGSTPGGTTVPGSDPLGSPRSQEKKNNKKQKKICFAQIFFAIDTR